MQHLSQLSPELSFLLLTCSRFLSCPYPLIAYNQISVRALALTLDVEDASRHAYIVAYLSILCNAV